MSTDDALDLIFVWTYTCGSQMVLQMVYCMTGTSVSMSIHFACRLVTVTLKSKSDAAI